MSLKSPYRKCENRRIDCHSECEKYRDYRKTRETISRKKQEETDVLDYVTKQTWKNQKKYETELKNKRRF